jgi:hypothetical protein
VLTSAACWAHTPYMLQSSHHALRGHTWSRARVSRRKP